MNLNINVFDLWTYHLADGEPKYLMMQTSQEKADKWFGGGRFWQIPGDFFRDDEDTIASIKRSLSDYNLTPKSIWTVEHTYTIYNRRRNAIEILPVFAAEVEYTNDIPLTWEHSEFAWLTAEECYDRVNFRGLIEGLDWTRQYITEAKTILKEFRLE
jgi:hypothetical protein